MAMLVGIYLAGLVSSPYLKGSYKLQPKLQKKGDLSTRMNAAKEIKTIVDHRPRVQFY